MYISRLSIIFNLLLLVFKTYGFFIREDLFIKVDLFEIFLSLAKLN